MLGKNINLRSGDITDPNDSNTSPETTSIVAAEQGSVVTFASGEGTDANLHGFTIRGGSAEYGGGISCDGASPTIMSCIIRGNSAEYFGGGIDCYYSSATIEDCVITGNRTLSEVGAGGGINCENGSPTISGTRLSYNFASNVGGGIACYNSLAVIYSCVLSNNSSGYATGGIDLAGSSPTITNCTIVVDDAAVPKSGGIGADANSAPEITNCIVWGTGDDLFGCSAMFSCIEDGDEGAGNIRVDPAFTTGPLGNYYLSQLDAGQLFESNCVDAGDPSLAIGIRLKMFSLTTMTDGHRDSGVVDMGAHFAPLPAEMFELNITVVDANGVAIVDSNDIHGYVEVDPNDPNGEYKEFQVVKLTAHPDVGYRITFWRGTDYDYTPTPNMDPNMPVPNNTDPNNMIMMVADANVTICFEEVPMWELRTSVIGGHGGISPYHRRGEYYPDGTVVDLTALPELGHIVDTWTGTDDETLWTNTNTVTMDSDKEVTVTFRFPNNFIVPSEGFWDIQDALDACYDHGDTVVVQAGTYTPINYTSVIIDANYYYFYGYDFGGKAITLSSEHPDDPCCVAATIIQMYDSSSSTFSSYSPSAFVFQGGEGNDSVVSGFTIQGSGDYEPYPVDGDDAWGRPGEDIYGGAIACFNGSSPTLNHLVIRDIEGRTPLIRGILITILLIRTTSRMRLMLSILRGRSISTTLL